MITGTLRYGLIATNYYWCNICCWRFGLVLYSDSAEMYEWFCVSKHTTVWEPNADKSIIFALVRQNNANSSSLDDSHQQITLPWISNFWENKYGKVFSYFLVTVIVDEFKFDKKRGLCIFTPCHLNSLLCIVNCELDIEHWCHKFDCRCRMITALTGSNTAYI